MSEVWWEIAQEMIMRKAIFFILIFFTSNTYSQSITTLSCVEKNDPKYQFVIKFDSVNKKIIEPLAIDYALNVTDDLISFKRKPKEGGVYTTIIYRSTGQYTIYAEKNSNNYTWTGVCSEITENKF